MCPSDTVLQYYYQFCYFIQNKDVDVPSLHGSDRCTYVLQRITTAVPSGSHLTHEALISCSGSKSWKKKTINESSERMALY